MITRTAAQILGDAGLPPPPSSPSSWSSFKNGCGRYYQACPRCSSGRSTKAHRDAKVLGVRIDDVGVKFGCNHCGWTGGGYFKSNSVGRNGGRMGMVVGSTTPRALTPASCIDCRRWSRRSRSTARSRWSRARRMPTTYGRSAFRRPAMRTARPIRPKIKNRNGPWRTVTSYAALASSCSMTTIALVTTTPKRLASCRSASPRACAASTSSCTGRTCRRRPTCPTGWCNPATLARSSTR